MFFANPVVALRHVREALAPGGQLNMVVWRRKLDNEFLHRAERVVAEYLDEPEESDAPRCGPGPFSMANADTVTDVLVHAGFESTWAARQDLPIRIGDDLEHAVAFNMSLGPAAEVLRMWGSRVDEIRPKIAADLRSALADFVVEGGAVTPGVDLGRQRASAGLAELPARRRGSGSAIRRGRMGDRVGRGCAGRDARPSPSRRRAAGRRCTRRRRAGRVAVGAI